MHHYGENAVRVFWSHEGVEKLSVHGTPQSLERTETFIIEITNHVTGVQITVTGPRKGIFLDNQREIMASEAERLGHEIAHLLRQTLQ